MVDMVKVNDKIVSEFADARATAGTRVGVGDTLERIRTDQVLRRMVKRIRGAADEKDQAKLKRMMPAITWSGEFGKREAAGILAHSGLVVLDFDHLKRADLLKLQTDVMMDPHVVGAFVSPRGEGYKVLLSVKIGKGASHRDAWVACSDYALAQGWGKADPSGKDCSRLCFLSYDPHAYHAEGEVEQLLVKAAKERKAAEPSDVAAETLLAGLDRRVNGVEIEDARAMLTVLDPGCAYEEWMGVGMALHAQWADTEHEQLAKELFSSWSAGVLWHGDTPANWEGDEDCDGKWESFGKREDGVADVTMRSLMKRAKDAGFQIGALLRTTGDGEVPSLSDAKRKEVTRRDADMLRGALAAISGATSLTELTGDVAVGITELELFDSSRETMLDAFCERYKAIDGGQKITRRAADELTAYNYMRDVTKAGCPEWGAPYVFCREKEGAFVCVDSMSITSVRSFNMAYASELITDVMKAQGKMHPYVMPSDLLVNADLVEKVHGTRYIPGEDRIVERRGERVLNRWLACDAEPVDPLVATVGEQGAVDMWRAHIMWLLGPVHGAMLEQFLGYVVQHPGERVRWAFLMKGPEGCGKTMIVNSLMRAVLGVGNVDVLDNSTLQHTSFNDWSDSRQLCMVEEIFVEGRAKWDVMNVMKPAITNDVLSIHAKGKAKYLTDNVTSYIMSTNHANALPLAAGDRRYYVCSSMWRGAEFLESLGGLDAASAYFSRLAASVDGNEGALLGWLRSVDLKGFNPNRAPDTDSKKAITQMSKGDLQVAIEDIIADGTHETVNRELVEMDVLKGALAEKGEVPSGQMLGRMLRDMGLEPIGKHMLQGHEKGYWALDERHLGAFNKAKNKASYLRNLLTLFALPSSK